MDLLKEVKPLVIHLYRENVLEALISSQLCTAAMKDDGDYPVHSYEPVEQQEVEVNCKTLVGEIESYLSKVDWMQKLLADFRTLTLT
jgi:hypothetical protein